MCQYGLCSVCQSAFGAVEPVRACLLFCRLPVFPSFLHTKKDSLHKTVCVNIVLVYCLRVFLYSFPRQRVVLVSYPTLRCPGLSMAVVSPARPRHYPLCYPAACAAGPAGSNLCPVSGAFDLKGGKKMKVCHK